MRWPEIVGPSPGSRREGVPLGVLQAVTPAIHLHIFRAETHLVAHVDSVCYIIDIFLLSCLKIPVGKINYINEEEVKQQNWFGDWFGCNIQ